MHALYTSNETFDAVLYSYNSSLKKLSLFYDITLLEATPDGSAACVIDLVIIMDECRKRSMHL